MTMIKSADEIARELDGKAEDVLPGVPILTNGDFARVVSSVINGTEAKVAGNSFDGTQEFNPLDVALLAHRVQNPSPLTEAMHQTLVDMNAAVEAGKDPSAMIESLNTLSESGKSLASLVGGLTPSASQHFDNGTEVSATGVGGGGRGPAEIAMG